MLALQVAVGGSGTGLRQSEGRSTWFEIEERRRERLKQLLELDRDVQLPQIIALGKKIDELIQSGSRRPPARTRIPASRNRSTARRFSG
jgi:hypothetical protein